MSHPHNTIPFVSPNPTARRCILVVADDVTLCFSIRRLLRTLGYEVLVATSAAQALGILEYRTPDAVVTDEQLIDHSGLELLERVAKEQPSIARVLLTLYTSLARDLSDSEDSRVHRVLLKPCRGHELTSTLSALVEPYEGYAALAAG